MNTVLSLFAAGLAGLATWSFTEYCMHRFLGHACKGRNHFSREHLAHHSNPDYFAPAWQKLLFALACMTVIVLVGQILVPTSLALAYASGFALSYGFYEWLHRRIHTHPPRNWYGQMVRKHHLSHHFTDARQCHGVTSRAWDRVFGTHSPVEKVRVPRKMATRWMLTDTGELNENFSQCYRLVGRPRS